jgi:hypothetical protein
MRHDTAANTKLTMKKNPSPMQNKSFIVAFSRDISGCYCAKCQFEDRAVNLLWNAAKHQIEILIHF